jgi:hypothetical protein
MENLSGEVNARTMRDSPPKFTLVTSAILVFFGFGMRRMIEEGRSRTKSAQPGAAQERMNSPLEIRKVRLRGLGGMAVCGVPRTCASAIGK